MSGTGIYRLSFDAAALSVGQGLARASMSGYEEAAAFPETSPMTL